MKTKLLAMLIFALVLCLCVTSCKMFSGDSTADGGESGITDGGEIEDGGNTGDNTDEPAPCVHTEIIDAAVAPTCTEAGLTEGKHCSLCGEVLVAQESVDARHSYGTPEILSVATCFIDGEQKSVCAGCGDEKIETVKQPHNFAYNEETSLTRCSHCGGYKFEEHVYLVIDKDTTWTGAKEYCERLGGHSVTITSQEENDFVSSIKGKCNAYWLGGIKENGAWHWITGEDFDYQNWGNGEPNNHNGAGEWYLEIVTRWNDTILGGEYENITGIICEFEVSE